MTTDAKIGLLLALVFIIAITFVINGLPDFLSKNKVEQPTTSYVKHYRPSSPGIVGNSRKVANRLTPRKPAIETLKVTPTMTFSSTDTTTESSRFSTTLPAADEVIKETSIDDSQTATAVIEIEKTTLPLTAIAQPIAAKPKTYIVKSGDSLAKIAVKAYGADIGNKLSSIKTIFNANRQTVKSIDSIYVGQKLIIPAIGQASPNIETQTPIVAIEPAIETDTEPVSYEKYIVKENDSLWKIANSVLDDGNRYHEIIELNKAILPDADRLTVGMTLKLPTK